VDNSYFRVIEQTEGGGRYSSGPATAGPWDPRQQHGGPPNSLLVHVAEQAAARAADRSDLIAVRIAAEFVGPVPVADVQVRARVVRAARSGVLVASTLSADGRDCLHARVWLVRDTDTSAVAHPAVPTPVVAAGAPGLGLSFPFGDSVEWRAVSGSLAAPGPGVVWGRAGLSLLPDCPLTGLERAVLIGESANGISSELDWTSWSFLNVDLDVHLARPMIGDWLRLDAATQLGPNGSALARSTLCDASGPLGCTAQTLVLAARR
jgi:hypothetical protein